MSLIDGLFKTAGLKASDLDAVACMRGPGSFTGLRIGYAAAKGLSLSLGIPFVTAPTLDCVALPHSVWPGLVLPVMDAKKGRFFAAFYRGGKRLTDFLDADPQTLAAAGLGLSPDKNSGSFEAPLLLTGPGVELLYPELSDRFPKVITKTVNYFDGRSLELLEIVRNNGILQMMEVENSGPLYIRKSDAELNLIKEKE
jgi:tRNA threonylcarbamoyladenosine biosynthesis protein TsaB